MKPKHFLSVLAVLVGLTGCLEEDQFVPKDPEGLIPINLSGDINQISTKVNLQGFEDQDALGLYAVNYENQNQTPGILKDSGNQADHAKYIFNEMKAIWQSVGKFYYKDINTNVDLYCYYPYSKPESVSAFNFEVKEDQSLPKQNSVMSPYEASDFMWGTAQNVVPTENKIHVSLNHMMSGAVVSLQEGTGFEAGEFALLNKVLLCKNTIRKCTIDLSTGNVTPIGAAPSSGIVMAPQHDGSFRAIIVPQTVKAGTKLFSITVGTKSYSYALNQDVTYFPGKLNKFTIKISKKYNSGEYELSLSDPQIVAWKEDAGKYEGTARQYYCVNLSAPGTLGQTIRADKKNPKKIKNLRISGPITESDFAFLRDSMTILEALNLKDARIKRGFIQGISYAIYDADNNYSRKDAVKEGYYDDVIPNCALDGKSTLRYFVFPDHVKHIGGGAFMSTNILGALVIPDGVMTIGTQAFDKVGTITSLSLPNTLEALDGYAFLSCTSLGGRLLLPESLKAIRYKAFGGCQFTGNLILPNSLESIDEDAFAGAGSFVGDLRIPDKITHIGRRAFSGLGSMKGRLDLNNAVYVGEQAFSQSGFTGDLVIPEGTTDIFYGTYANTNFSTVKFPKSLVNIEEEAFFNCKRLMGTIEIPEGIAKATYSVFKGVSGINTLILPASLSIIQQGAFEGCFGLTKIVSKAIEPPTILTDAFSGVGKDDVIVEVPESSVSKYAMDLEWTNFRKISAHQDFVFSRDSLRTLNAGCSRKYTLYCPSGQKWKVESKPDWINVIPSSGTGKAEIEVNVIEMLSSDVTDFEFEIRNEWGESSIITDRGRMGQITFLMEGKDYRSSMTVQQFDYKYADGDVITLNKATKGAGVNIVFMGDCYDALDISREEYMNDLKEAYGYFFAVEPYKSYKEYFNVYAVLGVSGDSGMGTINMVKDAKFGSQYSLNGIEPNLTTTFEYAHKADIVNGTPLNMNETLIVMVENTTDYGGICFMWGDGSAVAICPKSTDAFPYDFRGVVQHEAGGHGFGKLADEYIYHNTFLQSCQCICCKHLSAFNNGKKLGWYRNLDLRSDSGKVGWAHLIFHPKYSEFVDIYEGGFYHKLGLFRSEISSCMNNNIPYFSTISRQAIVERIMEYAKEPFTFDNFVKNDVPGFAKTRSFDNLKSIESQSSKKQYAPRYMGEHPNF